MTGRAAPRALLAAALLSALACGRGGGAEGTEMLPAATPPSTIPTGDPAGGADRGADRVRNPYARDQVATREGERLFREMNCVDCHGYKGEGGMGPPLTDGEWLFGDTPVDRFISVHRGRAKGMPSYGHLLPDESIWKIVAHVEALGKEKQEARRGGGEAAQATREAQGVGGRH